MAEKKSSAPAATKDPAVSKSLAEKWKAEKHGLDSWDDLLRYAKANTPMKEIPVVQLERMKWFGYYYRKNNDNDCYMLRVRIPGCELNAEQMRALAFIAHESGHGIADVTTRGNIQIQGLSIVKLPGVRATLEKVGLTAQQSGHDNVRNITSHPLSGLDPQELIDTRELSRKIQDLIVGNREFSDLPRKFNIALTGRPDPQIHTWTQDLGLVAARLPDDSVGFQMLLGGTQGQTPTLSWAAPVFVRVKQVVPLVAALLGVFRNFGYRHDRKHVRFHFLMERLGNEKVLELVEETLGYTLLRTDQRPPLPVERENFAGWFKQKQPRNWAACVCTPVGRISWEQMEGLAKIAKTYGDGTLRTSCDQMLVIPNMHIENCEKASIDLAALGLSVEADTVLRNMLSCTGKQFCNLSLTETKGFASQLVEQLRRRRVQLFGITIHFSGCPNSCGMTLTADIGLQGTKVRKNEKVEDGFDIYVGGGLGEKIQLGRLLKKGVAFSDLAWQLEQMINLYYRSRVADESFSEFWRQRLDENPPQLDDSPILWLCQRCGHEHLADLPPSHCPVCSAVRAKFDPASEDYLKAAAASSKEAKKKLRSGAEASQAVKPVAKKSPQDSLAKTKQVA